MFCVCLVSLLLKNLMIVVKDDLISDTISILDIYLHLLPFSWFLRSRNPALSVDILTRDCFAKFLYEPLVQVAYFSSMLIRYNLQQLSNLTPEPDLTPEVIFFFFSSVTDRYLMWLTLCIDRPLSLSISSCKTWHWWMQSAGTVRGKKRKTLITYISK